MAAACSRATFGVSHASIPVSLKQTFALPADLVRISVGIEDVDDLIEDLKRAFAIASGQQAVHAIR
jgi:cystathionine beta-lyase/cystathionine gamma-synthase